MRIVGADLSISSTALVLLDNGDLADVYNVKSKGRRGDGYREWVERINDVSTQVRLRVAKWQTDEVIDLVVIEAPSHGSRFGNPHERAALWWDVYRQAYALRVPVTTVAPKTRAKFLTGSGKANKKEVLAAARETYPWEIANDDVADALGLADMAARVVRESKGGPISPEQEETLEVPAWPLLARPL